MLLVCYIHVHVRFDEFVCVFLCDVEIRCHASKAEYSLVQGQLALKKGCRFDGAKSGL